MISVYIKIYRIYACAAISDRTFLQKINSVSIHRFWNNLDMSDINWWIGVCVYACWNIRNYRGQCSVNNSVFVCYKMRRRFNIISSLNRSIILETRPIMKLCKSLFKLKPFLFSFFKYVFLFLIYIYYYN